MVNAVFWCRSEQRSPSFVHLHDFIKKTNLITSMSGRRGHRPLQLRATFYCRKIATLFAGFTLFIWIEKAVQRFFLRHRFIISFTVVCFFYFSAPLGRLTPIEALPISCERSRTRNLLRKGLCPLTLQAL